MDRTVGRSTDLRAGLKAAPCEALKWCRLEPLGVVGKRPFFGLASVSLIRLRKNTVSVLRDPVAGSLKIDEPEMIPSRRQLLKVNRFSTMGSESSRP